MSNLAPERELTSAAGDLADVPERDVVTDTVRRLLRRGLLIAALGIILGVGFAVTFVANDNRRTKQQKAGEKVEAIVDSYSVGPPKVVTVLYQYPAGWYWSTDIKLDPLSEGYEKGDPIKVIVHESTQRKTTIAGSEKASRFTSLPASILAVTALAALSMAAFELQIALRVLRLLRSGEWSMRTWRGAVEGPGRGHVRAAGYLTSPDRSDSYLVENAPLCWRETLDLLDGKAVLHVLGDPKGLMLVRHPAALRPAIFRQSRTARSRQRAEGLLARSAERAERAIAASSLT